LLVLDANQVADFAGVSRGYLSELAGRKSPSLRTLVKIAATFEVEVRGLLG
jgi:transcriptional regulator with XRE-family HTH domain